MSIRVQELVWTRYPGVGTERTLALALAWFSNDDGSNVYPSVEILRGLLRQRSRRTVQNHLGSMRDQGFLSVVDHATGGRGLATHYQINLDWLEAQPIVAYFSAYKARCALTKSAQRPAESAQPYVNKGAVALAPEQSVNCQEQLEQQPARRARRASVAQRRVAGALPDDFQIDESLRAFALEHELSDLEPKVEHFTRWARTTGARAHNWDAEVRRALLEWSFDDQRQKQPKVDLDEIERRLRTGVGT